MPIKSIKTSYNSGELSEYMAAREDVNKYHNGASKMVNATVLPHGGFVKRSGTEYIATAPNKCNLIPFEFSVDDALVLEFSNLLLRFYKDGTSVLGDTGTEVDATYAAAGAVLSHWKMNDSAANTVIVDTATNYDGVASANTEDIRAIGHVGTGCMDLDGQYAIAITGGDGADFTFIEGNPSAPGNFSIAGWVYVNKTGSEQVIMAKWDETTGSQGREWKLLLDAELKLKMILADESLFLDTDLIAHWKLNDSLQTSAVIDATGNHGGTLADGDNNYTSDHSVSSKTGSNMVNAFEFDGSDDRITVDDHADLTFGDASNDSPFSISAWINMDDATKFGVSRKGASDNAIEWEFIVDSNDKLALHLYDDDLNTRIGRIYNTAITAQEGSWIHVVATYDATETSSGITLYLDGTAVDDADSQAGSYTAMHDHTADLYIGWYHRNAGGGVFANGKIDNVMMFNKELSQAEVTSLYNSGNGTEDLGSASISTVSDDPLDTGWQFIGMTYEGENGAWTGATAANYITLYVSNAVAASTATNLSTYVTMEDTAAQTRIGAQESTAGVIEKIFNGKIDNLAIFTDTMSAADMASLVSSGVYSIVSPYTSTQSFQVHTTQSADVMYLAHKDIHPQKLSRRGATDWIIEDVPFTGGPFLEENTTETSLVGFARTGGTARSGYYFPTGATGTLTSTSHSPFNSNMVGALWSVIHTRLDNTTSTPDNATNAAPTLIAYPKAVRTKGDYVFDISKFAAGTDVVKLWRKEGNGSWQEFRNFTAASAFSATEDEDNVYYSFTTSAGATTKGTFTAKNQVNNGIVKITGFTNSGVVIVTVVDPVLSDNSTDTAVTTSMWAEGAWSDFRGYPRTVTFFEDRLWWASTANNPDTLWSSKSGLYENMGFTKLGLDDEGITFPINDNEVSQIQWMQARQVMAVGAANKEYRFGNPDPDKAVTPSDKKATPQTSEGSYTIQPVILKDSIFFFQSLGKKIGKMKFDAITENFDVEDATMLVYRLFDSPPTNIAVQRVPDSIIWTVRTDGVAPTLTYEPKEEVLGWARQIFGNSASVETPTGIVESVAVIHGTSEDEVWISVLWNSLSARHVIRFKARDFGSDVEDAFYVDSGITYDSTATTTITGLTHLLGETVAVFADGLVQSSKFVFPKPIAHWKMNDIAVDRVIIDNSSNSNNGELDAGSTASALTSSGAGSGTGTSLDLSADGGSHYAVITGQTYYSFGDGSSDSPFSIAAWVYVPSSPVSTQVIVSKYTTAGNLREWYFSLSSGKLSIVFYDETLTKRLIVNSNSTLDVSGWHHVVMTYNGEGSSGITLYVDGAAVNSSINDNGYGAMDNHAADVIIGAYQVGISGLYNERLDDIRIYNVAIDATIVTALYNSGDGTEATGDGDSIILDTAASTVQVGLPYTMKVRTMRHSIPQEGTTIQTRIKKIERNTVRYIRSLLGMAGQEYDGVEYLQPIGATFSTEAKDTKPDNRLSQGGFSEDAYTTIISDDPVPFTGLASIIDIEVEK